MSISALRRALGFKLKRHGRLLPDLVAHLDAAGETTVTTRLALGWATQPAGHPEEWAVRLSIARGFARYLRALDGRAEVPPADLLPRCRRRPAPHLYTDQEIAALLAATETLASPLGRATDRTLLGLLIVSGMRIGEAIWLDRPDVDFESGRDRARREAGSSARAPASPQRATGARGVRPATRPSLAGAEVAGVLSLSRRWHPAVLRERLQDLPRPGGRSGPWTVPDGRRPRIHDARHTFAVRTLTEFSRSQAETCQR